MPNFSRIYRVLVGSPLPGSIGIGKVDGKAGLRCDLLELRELFPVVDGQGMAQSPGDSSEELDTLRRHDVRDQSFVLPSAGAEVYGGARSRSTLPHRTSRPRPLRR